MLLENKYGIIFGVANKRSIAWATAQACAEAGARLAFTYQNERLKGNVEDLTSGMDAPLIQCDVTNPAEVAQTFAEVKASFGRLDFLVHSLAFAPREALEGEFVATTREAFLTALDISAYSLAELARQQGNDDEAMALTANTGRGLGLPRSRTNRKQGIDSTRNDAAIQANSGQKCPASVKCDSPTRMPSATAM